MRFIIKSYWFQIKTNKFYNAPVNLSNTRLQVLYLQTTLFSILKQDSILFD